MEDKRGVRLAQDDELQSEVERFFVHLGRWKRPVFYFEKAWKPRCDVCETSDEIIVVAELAGIEVKSLDVRVEGELLILRGMRPREEAEEKVNYHIMEINYGPFERDIPLPCDVDAENAKATFGEGFLEIRIPKKVAKQVPLEVDVDASSR